MEALLNKELQREKGLMSKQEKKSFPSITECKGTSYESIAADLDGTLLISTSAFPYYMMVAVEAGSLLRGLMLILALPLVVLTYFMISEAIGIKILIFISYARLNVRDIELASRTILIRFYAANVRRESYEVFNRCKRKVVVTANPTVMVEPFIKEFLGGSKVLGTEIEVDARTNRATGFVRKPGVLVSKSKRSAVLQEFGDESPDLGIGDRETDHDFMAVCKEGYMVLPSKTASPVPLDQLKSQTVFDDGRFIYRPTPLVAILTYLYIPLGYFLYLLHNYLKLPLPVSLVRFTYRLFRKQASVA